MDKVRVDKEKWMEREDEQEVRRDEWKEVGAGRVEKTGSGEWKEQGKKKGWNDVEKGRRKAGEGKVSRKRKKRDE